MTGGRPVLAVMPGITPDAGAERSFVDVVEGLTDAGIDLHLALLTDRHALVPEVEAGGGTVHDLSDRAGTLERVRGLRDLIRRLEPAVVHATLHEATIPAQLAVLSLRAGRHRPTMLVTWANTSYTPEHFAGLEAPPVKLRAVQVIDAALSHATASRYHAVTSGVGRVNAANLRVRADRVFVGERGRDPQRFEIPPERLEATRATLGAPDGTRFVLGVGRQDMQKGYDLLLGQFDRVADDHADVWLLIAGRPGSATAALERQRDSMLHGDRVRFLGQRADAAELMTLASVVTCSSVREGAAGALIEAMACRTPIAAVALDGLEDVLVDGVNSLVVPRHKLGGAIRRLLDDPELAARVASGGRRTFEERFTIERSAARLAEIYRMVAPPNVVR